MNTANTRNNEPFDFMDGFQFFGFAFGSLLGLIVFGYVFVGLFTFEQPVVSTLFGLFLGMVAACMLSPFCAAIGFTLGAIVSGIITWFSRRSRR